MMSLSYDLRDDMEWVPSFGFINIAERPLELAKYEVKNKRNINTDLIILAIQSMNSRSMFYLTSAHSLHQPHISTMDPNGFLHYVGNFYLLDVETRFILHRTL